MKRLILLIVLVVIFCSSFQNVYLTDSQKKEYAEGLANAPTYNFDDKEIVSHVKKYFKEHDFSISPYSYWYSNSGFPNPIMLIDFSPTDQLIVIFNMDYQIASLKMICYQLDNGLYNTLFFDAILTLIFPDADEKFLPELSKATTIGVNNIGNQQIVISNGYDAKSKRNYLSYMFMFLE